jgi:uncharacterized coiled-coil DUF342 family protein
MAQELGQIVGKINQEIDSLRGKMERSSDRARQEQERLSRALVEREDQVRTQEVELRRLRSELAGIENRLEELAAMLLDLLSAEEVE